MPWRRKGNGSNIPHILILALDELSVQFHDPAALSLACYVIRNSKRQGVEKPLNINEEFLEEYLFPRYHIYLCRTSHEPSKTATHFMSSVTFCLEQLILLFYTRRRTRLILHKEHNFFEYPDLPRVVIVIFLHSTL
jgi:hypothetical protein